jgi:hypothetical protein
VHSRLKNCVLNTYLDVGTSMRMVISALKTWERQTSYEDLGFGMVEMILLKMVLTQ